LLDRLREQSEPPLVGKMTGQGGLSYADVAGDGKEQGRPPPVAVG